MYKELRQKIRKAGRKAQLRYHDIYPTPAQRRRNVPSMRAFSLATGALMIVIIASLAFRSGLKAETLALHPTSCLGGWSGAQKAEGAPETNSDSRPEEFTEDNSAVLPANTAAEIYCGGFSADIPPDTVPRSMVIAIALSAGRAPAAIVNDSYASSTGEVLDAPADSTIQIVDPAKETPPKDSPPAEAPAPESPAQAPDPGPAAPSIPSGGGSTPPPVSEPVSFRTLFTNVAHAEEVAASSSATSTEEAPAAQVPDGTFLEIRYTFDGKTWQQLSTLDADHAVSQSYAIELPAGATWKDLSAFQISIRTLPLIDKSPPAYLDGMTLQMGFEKTAPDPLIDPATGGRQFIFNASSGFIASGAAKPTETPPVLRSIDTLILSDDSPAKSGVAIFNAATGDLIVEADLGDREQYAHAATEFGTGIFIIIQTKDPGACTGLDLKECLVSDSYAKQWEFSVAGDDQAPAPDPAASVSTTTSTSTPDAPSSATIEETATTTP